MICCTLLVLCFLVVFVVCAVNRTMKRKSLESIARSIPKSKPTLLQYFFGSINASNAKPLWLVCNLMPLPFDGDGPLESLGPIVLGLHYLEPSTNVISPLPSLEIVFASGPSDIFISFQLQQFFLGCFLMQPLCFHHLGNPI